MTLMWHYIGRRCDTGDGRTCDTGDYLDGDVTLVITLDGDVTLVITLDGDVTM